MEWLLAGIATAITATYAVALGRGIAQRKRWAVEMARTVAMLNPSSADRHLFEMLEDRQQLEDEPNGTPSGRSGGNANRLAA